MRLLSSEILPADRSELSKSEFELDDNIFMY